MLITQGKTNWKYILIIVVLALIIGGGFLWLSTQQEVPITELPEIKKPEKVTQNETADWKTYRNEEAGYEIRYPNNWDFISETPERFQTISYSKSSRCGLTEITEFNTPDAQFLLPRYSSNILSFEEWFNEKKEHSFCREEQLITIADLPAVECFLDYACEFCACYSPYYVYLVKNDEAIELRGVIYQEGPVKEEIKERNKEKRQLYFNLFRQILSTFKFLE